MLLEVYRRLFVPLNGSAVLLLLTAGVLSRIASAEVGASRAGQVVAAAALVPALAILLRCRPTSGLALVVVIVALLTAAASLGTLGTGLVRLPVLIACVCLGALAVLCTFVRADGQASARDSGVR